VLGLRYRAKPVRPRLTLSLSDDDFVQLADEWGLAPGDRLKIKEIAAKKLVDYVRSTENKHGK